MTSKIDRDDRNEGLRYHMITSRAKVLGPQSRRKQGILHLTKRKHGSRHGKVCFHDRNGDICHTDNYF